DGSRLVIARQDEPFPVLRGSRLFRAADGAPDALDRALPACSRLVAPTQNRLFADAVAVRGGQSPPLHDRPPLEHCHRGQDRDTGDDDESEKDNSDRTHDCLHLDLGDAPDREEADRFHDYSSQDQRWPDWIVEEWIEKAGMEDLEHDAEDQ